MILFSDWKRIPMHQTQRMSFVSSLCKSYMGAKFLGRWPKTNTGANDRVLDILRINVYLLTKILGCWFWVDFWLSHHLPYGHLEFFHIQCRGILTGICETSNRLKTANARMCSCIVVDRWSVHRLRFTSNILCRQLLIDVCLLLIVFP